MSVAAYEKVVRIKTTSTTAWGSSQNICGNTATLTFNREQLDDTSFCTTGYRSRIAGLKDYNISITAIYSTTNAALGVSRTAFLAGTNLDFQYLIDGTNGFTGTGVITDYSHTGDVGSLETVDITINPTGNIPLTTV